MKRGDLVYATFDCGLVDDKKGLGLIAKVEPRTDGARSMGEQIYRIFWVDEDEPAWYYEHEVESVSGNR